MGVSTSWGVKGARPEPRAQGPCFRSDDLCACKGARRVRGDRGTSVEAGCLWFTGSAACPGDEVVGFACVSDVILGRPSGGKAEGQSFAYSVTGRTGDCPDEVSFEMQG